MSDLETQNDELIALESIYNDKELEIIRNGEELGGVFHVYIDLEKEVKITYKDRRRKDDVHQEMTFKYFPPLNMHFTFPKNYPSEVPPAFTLSSQWLSKAFISKLCKQLDKIWNENKGCEIIFLWINFLKEDSLKFLRIQDSYDLSGMYTYHLRHVEYLNRKMSRKISKESQENNSKQEQQVILCSKEQSNKLSGVPVVKTDIVKCVGRGRGNVKVHNNNWQTNKNLMYSQSIPEKSISPLREPDNIIKSFNEASTSKEYRKPNIRQVETGRRTKYRNKSTRNGRYHKEIPYTEVDYRAVLDLPPTVSVIQVLIDHNEIRQKEEFDHSFFNCNICFEEKSGLKCVLLNPCQHVFCKECMTEYVQIKISDGSVRSITCPSENCKSDVSLSQRVKWREHKNDLHDEKETFCGTKRHVKELVSAELFERYDSILLSITLDMMCDIIYCPRRSCQYPVSREENDNMARCPSCGFVFCIHCKKVYHGVAACNINPAEINRLLDQYSNGSAVDREKLEQRYGKKRLQELLDTSKSESWIQSYSRTCPKCHVHIEKSDGCNKMHCSYCGKMFCWICGDILTASNPYRHFGDRNSACFNKLFQGMQIVNDEEDEDNDFEEEEEEEELNVEEDFINI